MRGFFAPLRMTSNNGKSNSNGKKQRQRQKQQQQQRQKQQQRQEQQQRQKQQQWGMLFGSQGLHGVDCGGVAGWKQAGEDSDSNECQDGRADHNGVVGTDFEEHASYYAGKSKCDSNSSGRSHENGH